MRNKYLWQGEPVKVRFGIVAQKENLEKPMFWYNFECHNRREIDETYQIRRDFDSDGRKSALIPAIEVKQGSQTFLIANHYGIGVNKLLKGGWPNHTHFSLNGKFEECHSGFCYNTSFNLEEYEYHESERRRWQKANYPVEFERMENLRKSFTNIIKQISTQ